MFIKKDLCIFARYLYNMNLIMELNTFKDLTNYVNRVVKEKPEFKETVMDLLELAKLSIEGGKNTIDCINRAFSDINQMTGI